MRCTHLIEMNFDTTIALFDYGMKVEMEIDDNDTVTFDCPICGESFTEEI